MGRWFFALDHAGFVAARLMLEILWQSSILFAAVGIMAWVLRKRRAALRHALWVGVVVATPLLPLLGLVIERVGAPRVELVALPAYIEPAGRLGFRDEPTVRVPDPPGLPAKVTAPLPPAPGPPPHGFGPVYPPLRSSPWIMLLGGYAVGAIGLLGWMLAGQLVVHRWIRRGASCRDPRFLSAFRGAAQQVGLRRDVRLVVSDRVQVPLTTGLLRPVVLIPHSLLGECPEPELRALALHEVCHIARRDTAIQCLVLVVRAALFFHPLIHLACRRVSLLAEQACDDAVVDSIGDPVGYAKMLSRFAELVAEQTMSSRLAAGLPLTKGALLRRVEAVLSWSDRPARGLGRWALAGTLLVATAVVCLAASVPLAERRAAPEGSSDDSLLFDVTLRVQPQRGETLTRKLLVGHDQTRVIHLGGMQRVNIKGLGWEKMRDAPVGTLVYVRSQEGATGRLSCHARCFRRVVREDFPDGSSWIDTVDGPYLGALMWVDETARAGSKGDAALLRLKLEGLRRGPRPTLSGHEEALVREEAYLRTEAPICDGARRIQEVLGPEWELVGKAASHERSLWGINRPAAEREEQYRPGLEGCAFSFQHRSAKIPKHLLRPGQAEGPAYVRLWYRPRLAFIVPSPWLQGEQSPFPITIGAYQRGRSGGIADHEVVFADIAAPDVEGLVRRLRAELRLSLGNLPRTALTTFTPRSARDPTVFVLDGRPRPGQDHRSPSFYIRRALTPMSAETKMLEWEGFTPDLSTTLASSTGRSVLIMVGIEALADRCVVAIKEYVARGNGLLALGTADASVWFDDAMAKPGLLPGSFIGPHGHKRTKLALNMLHPCHAAMASFGIDTLGTATEAWSIDPRADAWPVAGLEPNWSWGWAFDSTYGLGRTMAVGVPLDRSRSDAPTRVAFMPWLSEAVRYLATPPKIDWGPERDGLALRLATMREDYPAGAPVRVALVLRNVGREPIAVVGTAHRSELEPWTVIGDGQESEDSLIPRTGAVTTAIGSLRPLAPGESLSLPVPEPYFRKMREAGAGGSLTWGLSPGTHRVELVYALRPERVEAFQWEGPRIWTGELRSNMMTLTINRR